MALAPALMARQGMDRGANLVPSPVRLASAAVADILAKFSPSRSDGTLARQAATTTAQARQGDAAFRQGTGTGASGPVSGTSPRARTPSALPADRARIVISLRGVNMSSQAYARLRTWVDNAVNGSPGYDFHAADAALMYRITRGQQYCTLAVTLTERQVAQAEAAIAAGQRPEVAGDSYLEVGPMIADLALTYDTCQSRLTASQRSRWAAYAEQAVWNVWNPSAARWGSQAQPWSGWSINNPGNNYHYSFLQATMYWALASNSPTWKNFITTSKIPPLTSYYAGIPGGGSQEGTGYGTAQKNLFELYRVWRDSTGTDLAAANPHASNSAVYWVHATVPTMDRFAPIGDQSRNSVPELYDYHRHLMLEARNFGQSAEVRNMATWWLNNISVQRMGQGANFRYDALLNPGAGGTPPTALHYVAQGTGAVFARSGWDANAMWMSYVAGPYNESHAHQDQGSFTLFSRGNWLAVTENIWSHSGINQGTDVHNVLRFMRSNPSAQQCTSPSGDAIVHQCEPSTSTATVTPGANGAITINSNLTPAYRGNPAVQSWQRSLTFANRTLTVLDNFTLGSGTTAFFQLNVPVQPTVSGNTITAGGLRVRVLQPANPTITLRNWNSVNGGEYSRGWRIDIGGSTTTYQVELTEI